MQTPKKCAIGVIGLATAALSACGSGHSTIGSHGSTVPTTAAPVVGTTAPVPCCSPPVDTTHSVAVTTYAGYVFKVSLASIGAQPSFMTDDGTGDGGAAVDAPPGSTIVVAKLNFANDSARPELMPLGIGVLPTETSAGPVEMTVPVADAAAFHLDAPAQSSACTVSGPATYAPLGYCNLNAKIGAFSPAQTDITQPPQVAPGANGSVTLESDQSATAAGWVPESAPVQDVKVFVQPNATCTCWVQLG
jgi:hypothetical protein